MRKALITVGSSFVLLAGMVSAQAQSADKGPVVQNSNAMSAADDADMAKTNIRHQIQSQLTKDGYTDVTIAPSSFYIHAKDKKGDPVAMVIGPDSFTEVTEVPMTKTASPNAAGTPPAGTKAPASKS